MDSGESFSSYSTRRLIGLIFMNWFTNWDSLTENEELLRASRSGTTASSFYSLDDLIYSSLNPVQF